jgi:hypothetical protein
MKSDLETSLRDRLARRDRAEILHAMGYSESKLPKAIERLDAALSDGYLGLARSHYDFRYSNRGFLRALLKVLDAETPEADTAIDALERELQRKRYGYRPWLFVETGFRRTSEPVLALAAMEGRRRIRLPESVLSMSRKGTIRIASRRARRHFSDNAGRLPLWGAIQEYKLIMEDAEQVVLDTSGELVRVEPLQLSSEAAVGLK